MELWFLVIPIIGLIFLSLNYRYEEINIIKQSAISVTIFWILYSVLAGICFMFDAFSFAAVLITELAIALVIFVVLLSKKGWRKLKISFEKERDIIILVLLFVAFLLTVNKFELYDTGQDQGLYQIEALELYMGNFEVQHDFEEYQILEDAADKEAYYRMLDEVWVGYYPLSAGEYTDPGEAISEVSGMYHGVQTFPAMLALISRLFGMEHMMQLQTILYLCSIILLYYTMCDMNVAKIRRTLLTMVFMLSPLVLWISKNTYTEMFLGLMVTFYLFTLFERNEKKWMMCVPLIGFSFVHVSFLIIWPIFWVANTVLYIYKKNKQYVWANIGAATGVIVGYIMMSIIAPEYFYDNCKRLFLGNVVTNSNLIVWIVSIALLSCVISMVFLKIKTDKIKGLLEKLQNINWIIPTMIVLAIIYWIVYGAKMGYFMLPEMTNKPEIVQYYGQGMMAYTHLAIYACALATGFVILPCVLGCMLVKAKQIVAHVNNYVLVLIFMYIVVLQSVLFREEICYYFYYSRYLLYYIPIICLVAAVCFEKWNNRIAVLAALLSISSMLYFDVTIIENKDNTKMEWETVMDLSQCIEDDAAIIICGEGMQSVLGPQLRVLTDEDVFPMFEDLCEQVQMLHNHYDKIYVLSEADFVSREIDRRVLNVVYRDSYQYSMAPMFTWGIYPMEIEPISKDVLMYEIDIYESGEEILFTTENRNADKYVTQGLSHNEQTFAWTVGNKLDMQFWMDSEMVGSDAKACFEVLYVYNGPQEVQVVVNDELIDTVTVVNGEMLEFTFEVPQEVVNIELIFPNAVSPMELGESLDDRKLALGIVKATFENEMSGQAE